MGQDEAGGGRVQWVEDPADPRLDDFRDLSTPAARMRREVEEGFLVAEGATVVARLLTSGLRVRSVLVTPAKLPRIAVVAGVAGVEVLVVSRHLAAETVGFDLHRGVVASADRPDPLRPEDLHPLPSLVVVEGVSDHENLGGILRSAAAFGVGGILCDPRCADPWYRRSVRVSMGAALVLPIARATSWPDPLHRLDEAGFEVVALTPDPSAEPIARVDLRGRRPALLVGAEGPGLTVAAMEAASRRARVPMAGGMDSLNVSHALAVAAYELLARRDGGSW